MLASSGKPLRTAVAIVDTDVMVDVLREHPPAVAWLRSLGEEEIVLPGYVLMELLQGCRDL